ncbi:lipid A biosynthesis lauroyl acyltransferase [Legionella sp. km535]|uniref:lysophospholipid acyltransferase family protein n=1 Tax=Legionella sp. km535 TaxID=2498107 RepID=UPI000F8F66B2|nr:lysophospholipid acyltransferase family protein [Legionella sp. km535]RUR20555.1 lipid A biosynthesis lauroyl acyltransferase [Legionella sp. km535]
MKDYDFSKLRVTLWGRLMCWIVPLRKNIITSNIDRVFKDNVSPAAKKRLLYAFYSHLVMVLRDILLVGWLSTDSMRRRVEIRGAEHFFSAVNQGKGVLVLSGHLGSWELAVSAGLLHFESLIDKIHIIRRPIRKKWLEQMIFQRFYKWNLKLISSINAPKLVSRALNRKEIVLFFFDQHASIEKNSGLAVDFFSAKAGTYRSLAVLASKYCCPVVPLSCYREGKGKHVIEFFPALEWQEHPDHSQAIYNNTLIYNQTLERMILAHPEQWWWVHRRWKI